MPDHSFGIPLPLAQARRVDGQPRIRTRRSSLRQEPRVDDEDAFYNLSRISQRVCIVGEAGQNVPLQMVAGRWEQSSYPAGR